MTTSDPTPILPVLARYAVLVDVGYLYASAGELLFGTAARKEFRVDAEKLIQALEHHAESRMRGDLLRTYWYDAARDRVPTIDQRVIAQLPRVKLRLGNLNARGQQKGVDAQIRTDLEALARYRALTDAVLVAGDEDMVPAVEAAQAYGVRVHLWGIEPPYGTNQAERLVWESDTVEVLDAEFLRPYFALDASRVQVAVTTVVVPPPAPAAPSPAQVFAGRTKVKPPVRAAGTAGAAAGGPAGIGTGAAAGAPGPVSGTGGITPVKLGPSRIRVEEVGEHVAHKWIVTRGQDNIRDLLPGPMLPPVIDKELLIEAEKELGLSLRPYQEAREWLRDAFWVRVYREFGLEVGVSKK